MDKEIIALLRESIKNNTEENRLLREEIHSLRLELQKEVKPLNDFRSRMLAYVTILGATISAAGTYIVNKLMS